MTARSCFESSESSGSPTWFLLPFLLLALVACDSSESTPPGTVDPLEVDASLPQGGSPTVQIPEGCDDAAPTYGAFMAPLMEQQCLVCHSASLEGVARNAAPPMVNFDTEDDVLMQAERIYARAVELQTMPPGSPLDECDRARLAAYLDGLDAPACEPTCDGRVCGGDGCGGTCGECAPSEVCDEGTGQCMAGPCLPNCEGASCGDDGCGGSCGACGPGLTCDAARTCICQPQCDARTCGEDGCGGVCGTCANAQVCGIDGTCLCIPDCAGKVCGDDGCGGTCGSCALGDTCTGGSCSCVPDCAGRACGPDGCGGSCGNCMGILVCNTRDGRCGPSCTPDCSGRSCGDDGCGGSCGDCPLGDVCDSAGQCGCAIDCVGMACGDDGCGGTCGSCPSGTQCNGSGQCGCTADCSGRECGSDGCGGSCGSCSGGMVCSSGQCAEQCVPACSGKSCGDDGCGGSCGACAAGQSCSQGACEWPTRRFSTDVYPILQASGCGANACHGGVRPAEGLNLSSASKAYSALVGVASSQCASRELVAPGDPSASYLINKLTGVGMCSGSRMPKTGPSASTSDVDAIRAWIAAGAKND